MAQAMSIAIPKMVSATTLLANTFNYTACMFERIDRGRFIRFHAIAPNRSGHWRLIANIPWEVYVSERRLLYFAQYVSTYIIPRCTIGK